MRDNKFFTKNEKNLRVKHLEGAPKQGALPRSPPLDPAQVTSKHKHCCCPCPKWAGFVYSLILD